MYFLVVVIKCLKTFYILYVLGQIIVSNLTNVRKVTAKTKLDFMKPGKKTNIKCNIITHSYQSRCSSWKRSSESRIAEDFWTLLCIQSTKSNLFFKTMISTFFFCERFEPRSHFRSRLNLIVGVNVVLNRTVVVDSDVSTTWAQLLEAWLALTSV